MKNSMKSKEKNKFMFFVIVICILVLIFITIKNEMIQKSYAVSEEKEPNELKISNVESIDLDAIIKNNLKNSYTSEEVYEKQEELEYITKYRNNSELYVGVTKVSEEGRNGIQTITMKKKYDSEGNFIGEEQISCKVTKASVDKIIDIGTKIYVEPKKEISSSGNNYSSSGNLSFDMALNKPSGFTLEQFKTILTDSKDVNKVFRENADYFYYIEQQYCINGIFVASMGIHESAWATSKLAKNKYNLFGYGAYDSNPYNGAYTFSNYSEAIDLIARVLVKYYLNPPGTKIYDGQVASGKYYNGSTLSSVNKKYATDTNWANAIYKYMQYLYNKI